MIDENFDWSDESKEKYWNRAEQMVAAAGYSDILRINRESFAIMGADKVRIYLHPFKRQGNVRRWYAAKAVIPGLGEFKTYTAHQKREKSFAIMPYLVMSR